MGSMGEEYISTEVDIGEKPPYIVFDEQRKPTGLVPETVKAPIPLLFDRLPPVAFNREVCEILSEAAAAVQTFAFMPFFESIVKHGLKNIHLVPILKPQDFEL